MLLPIIFHKVFLTCGAVISALVNGLLLLLLLTRNGNHLGNYRSLLVLFAVTDIFISCFHAWHIPMIVLGDYGYIVFGYGTLRPRGPFSSNAIIMYSILFYVPFCLLLLYFVYRYLSLIRPNLLKERFSVFMACCSIYVSAYAVLCGALASEITYHGLPERFHRLLDEYDIIREGFKPNIRTVDYLDDRGSISIRTISVICAFAFVGGHTVVISLFCIHKIVGALRTAKMEIHTRRLHQNLFRALLIQFTVPVVFSLMPFTAIVLLPATGISMGQWGNVFSLLTSVFPVLDPILIILSLGRFRKTLLAWSDLICGTTARRNEKRAIEQSSAHYSMIIRRMSRFTDSMTKR